ncbi:MAG: hypothetical protein KGH89_03295 [Thaumarchaeota archaeon]|nr:hypothetical protein [Nitrososphaerota archaeon]
MQKRALITVVIVVVIIVVLIPVGYGLAQRATVTSLKFHFNRAELANVDFSQTQTIGNLEQLYNNIQNPSLGTLSEVASIESAVPSESTIMFDLLANTRYTFNVYVDVSNPSFIPVVIDKEDIKVSISGHELPGDVTIPQQITVPAGGSTTVELEGITASGRDIADVLANSISNDYVLDFNFAITSFYPTLFGEVQIPADIDLITYPIPPKPTLSNFQQDGYNVNSYTLSFQNSNNIPIEGQMQVGVMKGNSYGCDPACIVPVDSGLGTFLRITGSDLFGIQVFEANYNPSPEQTFSMNIQNPTLRNNANSAFIMRWVPTFDTIPYTATITIAGVPETSQGEFHSSTFSTIRDVVYNLGRDFGYVGSREFVSPTIETAQTPSSALSNTINSILNGVSSAPQLPPVQSSGTQIVNGVYNVPPGRYQYFTFTSSCTGTLSGSFAAQATLGNNIVTYVLDQAGFNQFQAGNSASTYYNSGKISSGSFHVSLGTGTYYIILSNTYSIISTKTVDVQAYYSCN